MHNLFDVALQCIQSRDPYEKYQLTRLAAAQWRNNELLLEPAEMPHSIEEAGRPDKPHLVHSALLTERKLNGLAGQAALIHAIVHIEFNAINLAWDAVYRFRDMPINYYSDWIHVADEEAYHFELLAQRLGELGYSYGDFDAHDGLWEMARQTDDDVMVRMALVPRVLEARGLDATPRIISKLRSIKDNATIAILDIILRDEIGHVAIGTHWFNYCCEQRGLPPEPTFKALLLQYGRGKIRTPFHKEARRQAGFTESELALLEELSVRIYPAV